MSKPIDLTGQHFGKLTVLSRAENDGHSNACWYCVCDCGNTVTIGSENKTVNDWAQETGLSCSTILSRLKNGWSPEDAVLKPKGR